MEKSISKQEPSTYRIAYHTAGGAVMHIISQIKINGEWVDQESIPREEAMKIIAETICRAANNAGFAVDRNEKTA